MILVSEMVVDVKAKKDVFFSKHVFCLVLLHDFNLKVERCSSLVGVGLLMSLSCGQCTFNSEMEVADQKKPVLIFFFPYFMVKGMVIHVLITFLKRGSCFQECKTFKRHKV
jgi:hypothetical protein